MNDTDTLSVQRRDVVGKGSARAARRAGMIPGVVYGLGKDPISIAVDELALNRMINSGALYSQLYKLDVGGETLSVLARDLQVHPVTDRAMHIDFLRVDANAEIAVEIPVVFLNEDNCPGLTEGGILNVVRYSIEVSCRPDAIPEQIEVDLANAQVGDSLHISEVALPDGVTPTITDRDFTIATIAQPRVEAEPAADDAEGGGDEAVAAESGEGGDSGGEEES